MSCAIGDSVRAAVNGGSSKSVDRSYGINALTADISITEHDVDANLFTSHGLSPPLDVLIRSSGVKRFSDFLLWQVCNRA